MNDNGTHATNSHIADSTHKLTNIGHLNGLSGIEEASIIDNCENFLHRSNNYIGHKPNVFNKRPSSLYRPHEHFEGYMDNLIAESKIDRKHNPNDVQKIARHTDVAKLKKLMKDARRMCNNFDSELSSDFKELGELVRESNNAKDEAFVGSANLKIEELHRAHDDMAKYAQHIKRVRDSIAAMNTQMELLSSQSFNSDSVIPINKAMHNLVNSLRSEGFKEAAVAHAKLNIAKNELINMDFVFEMQKLSAANEAINLLNNKRNEVIGKSDVVSAMIADNHRLNKEKNGQNKGYKENSHNDIIHKADLSQREAIGSVSKIDMSGKEDIAALANFAGKIEILNDIKKSPKHIDKAHKIDHLLKGMNDNCDKLRHSIDEYEAKLYMIETLALAAEELNEKIGELKKDKALMENKVSAPNRKVTSVKDADPNEEVFVISRPKQFLPKDYILDPIEHKAKVHHNASVNESHHSAPSNAGNVNGSPKNDSSRKMTFVEKMKMAARKIHRAATCADVGTMSR